MPILGIMASSRQPAANAGSFESIATVTVGSGGASSVTFSSIPSTYTHLQIRGIFKGGYNLYGQFNSDTGNNYKAHYIYGNGSSVAAGVGATQDIVFVGRAAGDGSQFGGFVCDILDYNNTNKYKTVRALMGWDNNGSGEMFFDSGVWMSTSAITSIYLYGPGVIAQYSSFALYGIKSS